MPKFPVFNFPYYYPYYRNFNNYKYYPKNHKDSGIFENSQVSDEHIEKNSQSFQNCQKNPEPVAISENERRCQGDSGPLASEKPIFEIFGIKLYIDDILILCLLYFLYEENVKDDMLFMVLLLLLIS